MNDPTKAPAAASTCPPSPYLDWNQAEAYSHLSRAFLRRRIAEGRLPVIRVGGRVLIHRDDLDAFLNKHRTTGPATTGRGATASC